jgi:acetyl esterase/lipase
MKKSVKKPLCLLYSFIVLSWPVLQLNAASDMPPKVKEVVFDASIGDRGIMEIHFPEHHDPSKPVPGIILFHGGSWKAGSLSAFRYAARYFASRGMVAATSNYELHKKEDADAGLSRYEVTNSSVRRAFRWFKAHAEELGIDPERIVGAGGSAGAQSILGATLDTQIPDLPGDDKSIDLSVAAYVLFNPATGLQLMEGFGEDVDITAFPPTLAMFGTMDWAFGKNYEKLHDALTNKGAPRVELWWAPFEGHAFFNSKEWYDACLYEADRFLESLGLLEGAPKISLAESGERLTPNKEIELPEEIRSRNVYVLRQVHTKGCRKLEGKLDQAEIITAGQALDKGLYICTLCSPMYPRQCGLHHIAAKPFCRPCKRRAAEKAREERQNRQQK